SHSCIPSLSPPVLSHSCLFCVEYIQSLDDSVDNGLRTCSTARNIYIDRDHGIDPALDIVTFFKHTARAGADPDSHHDLRFRHLAVDLFYHTLGLAVHAAGDQQDVRLERVSCIDDTETLDVVFRCKT